MERSRRGTAGGRGSPGPPPAGGLAAPPGRLPREFYTRAGVLTVARELLGKRLVVPGPGGQRVAGIIVETEAYRAPHDRASHAYGGRRTRRTETMYALGGTAYVYFVYGLYHQFNVVTGAEGVAHAVLVRALEPAEGLAVMRARRPGRPDHKLASGPGALCLALGIDRSHDRADLLGDRVWLEDAPGAAAAAIARGPRIGIDYAGDWAARPWRFWLRGSPFVSRRGPEPTAAPRPASRPPGRAARDRDASAGNPR